MPRRGEDRLNGRFTIDGARARPRRHAAIPIVLLALVWLLPAIAGADTIEGLATLDARGDLHLDGVRVTLFSITVAPSERDCRTWLRPVRCGPRALLFLEDRLEGFVHCEVARRLARDHVVAVCTVAGARLFGPRIDLAAQMLIHGWAFASAEAPPGYRRLQQAARRRGLGVWRPESVILRRRRRRRRAVVVPRRVRAPGPASSVTVLAMVLSIWAIDARAGEASPCGVERACEVADGTYHMAMPADGAAGQALPAVLFFHGYGASGGLVLGDAGLAGPIARRGYLLIAPDGLVPPGRDRASWSHQGSPSQVRDEPAFVTRVLDDVATRLEAMGRSLDRGRILVAGFSQGGSMAWHMACFAGDRFAGFAPVSGAFWQPLPEDCPGGPVRMLHVHGLTDQVVPLEGRAIGDHWHQGDTFASMHLLRAVGACGDRPDRFETPLDMRCRIFEGCTGERTLELCLHDGGHAVPAGWADLALDWFESFSPPPAPVP